MTNSGVIGLGELAALAGGLLLPFAFAPFETPYLAIPSLAMLFFAWLRATPGRAFWRGYLFGLGQFGVGVGWVYISIHRFGGADTAEASLLTALFVLFLGLYPAVAGYLAQRIAAGADATARLLLYFPTVWTLVEWFRSWFLTGFPWLNLGSSQVDTPLGQGLAPLVGAYGITWAVALLAGLALLTLIGDPRLRLRALAGVAGLFLGCALLARVDWVEEAGKPFKATLLQGNVPQNLKWRPEVLASTLDLYSTMTRANWDSHLVVWPETAVPAFHHEVKDGPLAALQQESRENGTDVLVGVPVVDPASQRYYNALVSLGAQPGMYYKRHMVPFGEFIPFRPLFGAIADMLQIPLADFARGTDAQSPLMAAGYEVSTSICYEDAFGHESRFGLPAAGYLVNVTNDAWFGDSWQPHQHLQMARMRALETGRSLLRATNTGITAAISPRGWVIAQAPQFTQTALTVEITPMQGATPYVRFGDWTVAGAAALVLLSARRRVLGLSWLKRVPEQIS
ncbi:apolipoprotein N-acyltransferase [Methyloterricola oryzae]|uniref:apolipoprotein N-acyltransferase n=1 Tax=Methyloterricola oryzae TaxID=1495050 RepID=UPI0005EB14E0|nr:apolipoprotein N-acyltransferase [Methyloterricola oryzae]